MVRKCDARGNCKKVTVWGYKLLMPGRPNAADQAHALKAAGVSLGQFGTCWCDRLKRAKRHRTAGQTQLVVRNNLLRAAVEGDTVVVTNAFCLGVSPTDTEWFLGQLAREGVAARVGEDVTIQPGEDFGAVVAEAKAMLNRYGVAKSRGRV